MNENITKEIEELKKIINKIENKCTWSYIGIGIGVVLAVYALLNFMINPDLIKGCISIFFIGGVVFLINYISLKQRKKRIEELSIDLKKMEEL